MVKRKHFGKRFATCALAGILGLSSMMSVAPLTVHAASTPSTSGRMEFSLADSSVYGADRTLDTLGAEMYKPINQCGTTALQQYWSSTLNSKHFMHCPEGLATFHKREIMIFDVSYPDPNDNQVYIHYPADKANGYYSYDYLTKPVDQGGLGLNDVHTVTMTLGNAVIDQSAENHAWLFEGHKYVLVENPSSGVNESGYYPNTEVKGANGVISNIGWQANFEWEDGMRVVFDYDDTGKTGYRNGNTLYVQPLHNEVMRAGFKFSVRDKDLLSYDSQASGDIEGAVFAVYNISSDGADGYPYMADGSAPTGYVVADRDNSGAIDSDESLEFIPAYTESDVINAYQTYLSDLEAMKDENGDGIVDGTPSTNSGANTKYQVGGEFVIGNNSAGKPIIPVMTLSPDQNGIVSTSGVALPVGNYLIVQVQSGTGYYIDEDFRPIVSVGSWSKTDGTQVTGYGRGYYGRIDDVAALTPGINNASTFHTTKSPVAFIPTGRITDLAGIQVDGGQSTFYVDTTGYMHFEGANPGSYGPTYVRNISGASGGNYIINSEDPRMKPVVGGNKFTAYNAIIRAGSKTYVADADDLNDATTQHNYANLNISADGNYLIIPQGNGDLNGAEFTLKNLNPNPVKLYTTGGTVNPGDENGHKYVVQNNMLLIPLDDLAYGAYALTQTSFGEGYEASDWTTVNLFVTGEDKLVWQYTSNEDEDLDAHRVGNRIHLPNQIINGGEIYSLMSNTADADKSITVSVYNISEQYVYVDKDGNGEKERYETNLNAYNSQIAGKGLTHEQLLKVVNTWTPCSVQNVAVNQTVSETDTLPYGDYLVVVTNVPDGFALTSEYMTIDSIEADTDVVTFTGRIENIDTMPVIDTVFEDAETLIDSIAVKERVFLQDRVTVSNLEGGMKYDLYGVIADAATGDILHQGTVGFATITAYTSTDSQTTPGVTSTAVDMLIQEGTACTTPNDEYVVWLNEVRNYAVAISNETLVRYCDEALSDMGTPGSTNNNNAQAQFESNKALIMGTLKYLAGGIGDTKLDGTADATMLFNYIDTREMEGKTLVAYQYICSHNNGTPIEAALLATNTGELLAALDTVLLGTHKDVTDEDQTVRIPTLDISAEASYTGVKTIDPSETVKATVSYGNLEIGNDYTMEVRLYDEFGNPVKEVKDGKETENDYVLTETFHAYAVEGELEFVFEDLDVAKFNDQRLTAYATLYRHARDAKNQEVDYWLIEKGDADSMGYDINDEVPGQNQVDVIAPTVLTVLTDSYGNKVVDFDATVTLKDTVTYRDLIVGAKYEAKLTLVNSEGIALLDDNGKELTATVEFTATETEQVVEIPITFNGKTIQGINIVAFNDLYRITTSRKALVAQEHDALSADQTIEASGEEYKVVISTVALDDVSHTHVVPATDAAAITDNVEIRNLEPSTKYILVTEMAYAKNGTVVSQIAPVETEITTDNNGRAVVAIPVAFNATVFQGQKLVVFQTLYDGSKNEVIATHANKDDANQTIMVPAIDTVATANDGTSKLIVPTAEEKNMTNDPNAEKVTIYKTEIMDTITFTNLVPGNTYRITTEVVSRDGKGSLGITTTDFVPTTSSGTTTTFSEVDVTNYLGSKLVVTQVITDVYSETEIVIHKDLTDEDQTVEIVGDKDGDGTPDPIDPDPENPDDPVDPDDPKPGVDIQTGVAENYGVFFALAILLFGSASIVGVVYARKRKASK